MNEQHITNLVTTFYARARAHPALGPFFETVITDWDHHLEVVQNFWSHALLGTQRYKGHPFPAHMDISIQREHFDQWLELFRPTALETLPEDLALKAIARAEHMAESFRAGLFPFDRPAHTKEVRNQAT